MAAEKIARYGSANAEPCWPVGNYRRVFDWMSGPNLRSTKLWGSRPDLLAQVLGPSVQTWVGGSGRYRNSVWRADADGIPIWVLCSKRGTSYEVEHPQASWDGGLSPDEEDKVLGFLARLHIQLEELEPSPGMDQTAAQSDPVMIEAARRLDEERPKPTPR